jgi:DNA-binding XRE family transcriptional regulator
MRARRTARTVRLNSTAPHSLVRTRTSRKVKSRKRPKPKLLADKLRAVRELLGLSQSEIARQIGVENRASISGYEHGEREPPLPVLLAYSKLANISTDILINDEFTVEDLEGFKGTSRRK